MASIIIDPNGPAPGERCPGLPLLQHLTAASWASIEAVARSYRGTASRENYYASIAKRVAEMMGEGA